MPKLRMRALSYRQMNQPTLIKETLNFKDSQEAVQQYHVIPIKLHLIKAISTPII